MWPENYYRSISHNIWIIIFTTFWNTVTKYCQRYSLNISDKKFYIIVKKKHLLTLKRLAWKLPSRVLWNLESIYLLCCYHANISCNILLNTISMLLKYSSFSDRCALNHFREKTYTYPSPMITSLFKSPC